MIKTYLNKNKSPIIRKCANCINYKLVEDGKNIGYCKAIQLLFAFTHEKSVYGIVKDFYLCESHVFSNEDILKAESEEVELLPYLTKRNSLKNI
jgi:hypothetical protein